MKGMRSLANGEEPLEKDSMSKYTLPPLPSYMTLKRSSPVLLVGPTKKYIHVPVREL